MARYRAFGLNIESDLPLPSFLAGDGSEPDVTINVGSVVDPPPTATQVTEWAWVNPTAVWLAPDTGDRFCIEGGRQVTYQSHPTSSDAARLVYLLASGFGALLHQRGFLTLHAGAIATEDGAVGFLGRSGIGKSTTTSGLVDAGYRLVTDDILALNVKPDAATTAVPAFPSMKVCADVLDMRTGNGDYAPIPSPLNKVRVPAENFDESPLPLAALYVLRLGQVDNVAVSDRLTPAQCFRVLERETFRRRFTAPMGRRAKHFEQLTQVAAATPVYVVRRPSDHETHAELLDTVQAHLADKG